MLTYRIVPTAALASLTLTLALIVTPAHAGGDPAAAAEKAQTCAACHGPDGNKPIDPAYPKLAGQYEDYLAKALHDYRSGARKNVVMQGQAAALTDADIANLSAFFAEKAGDVQDLSHFK